MRGVARDPAVDRRQQGQHLRYHVKRKQFRPLVCPACTEVWQRLKIGEDPEWMEGEQDDTRIGR